MAYQSLSRLMLANWSDILALQSPSRQDLFNAGDKVGTGDSQDTRKFEDSSKRRAVVASLQEADVLGMVATLKRELLLRQATLFSQLRKYPRKCSFLRRVVAISSGHSHHGVCWLSLNSSTKYTIQYSDWVECIFATRIAEIGL